MSVERSLLLCTNGAPEGLPALSYGAWLAQALGLRVTLLGIVESENRRSAVEQALRDAQSLLEAKQVAYAVVLREGIARQTIIAEALPERHIVVIGPLGRPRWRRWVEGMSLRRVMPGLGTPLLYAPTAHCQLERILLCTGALEYADSAECWALNLARRLGAVVTILHVAEPVLYHYPPSDQIKMHWKELLQTDTVQARHLRALLERAKAKGVQATIQIRQGTIVHEIVAEARRGQHDLVVMGSKHSARSLRRLYLPDVTAEVMESLNLPVLAVRAGQPCFLEESSAG
jgi:nucleotide-binding universal stress UspA family protein